MSKSITILPFSVNPLVVLPSVHERICKCGCQKLITQTTYGERKVIPLSTDKTIVLVGTFTSFEVQDVEASVAMLRELLLSPTLSSIGPSEVELYLPCHHIPTPSLSEIHQLAVPYRLRICNDTGAHVNASQQPKRLKDF